jgi:hypothetical protein
VRVGVRDIDLLGDADNPGGLDVDGVTDFVGVRVGVTLLLAVIDIVGVGVTGQHMPHLFAG